MLRCRRLAFAVLVGLGSCSTPSGGSLGGQPGRDDESGGEYVPLRSDTRSDLGGDGPLVFHRACEDAERTITIAAVGDLLLHGALQRQAFGEENHFQSLWTEVSSLLQSATLAYANLEGPAAAGIDNRGQDVGDPGMEFGSESVYTGYPQFNYHPQLIADLVSSGIDVVSTANNHALDRGSIGVDRTIEALDEHGLPYTGTRLRTDPDGSFHTTVYAEDSKIAWLACTDGTNGISNGREQVLHCVEQRAELLEAVRQLDAREDIAAIIVTPHWGTEYDANPTPEQSDLAHELAEAGALAVLGSHPHVLQPWEHYVTQDGREAFIAYSLGTFAGDQSGTENRTSILLYLGLSVSSDGDVHLNGARYVPLYILRSGQRQVVPVDPATGEHTEALDHVLSILDAYNLMRPSSELITNAHCDPDWVPSTLTPNFVGDACSDDTECAFHETAFCHEARFCTMECEGTCPGRDGYAETFCAELTSNHGLCVVRPEEINGMCADIVGSQRRPANRHVGASTESHTTVSVCAPAS